MDINQLTEDQILNLLANKDALEAKAQAIKAQREKEEAEAKLRREQAKSSAKQSARDRSIAAMRAGAARSAKGRTHTVGVAWYDELSTEDQMRVIAEANLRAYGSITAPVIDQLEALSKECPSCHETKSVKEHFGYRRLGDLTKAQSHCASCRAHSAKKARAADKSNVQ